MTTLNARANQAWQEYTEQNAECMPEFTQEAFEEGWEAGYKTASAALPYLAPAEPCPTCNGREWINGQWVARRETVGMVCRTCGRDYAPAVPQPVDREALARLLWDNGAGNQEYNTEETAWYECGELADKILTLLAGEQEQVQK